MFFRALGNFVQFLLDAIVAVLNMVCQLFPPSPFEWITNSQFGQLLADINFFLPIYEFLAIGQAWLIAIAAYYAYSLIARWVKAIE